MHRRIKAWMIVVVIIVTELIITGVASVRDVRAYGVDSGVEACRMMLEDGMNGDTPDDARREKEIAMLTASHNIQLRTAGAELASGDTERAWTIITSLRQGCTEVGVRVP